MKQDAVDVNKCLGGAKSSISRARRILIDQLI